MNSKTQIELFHHHKSTCSHKVRLCLAEKNIPWTSHFVDISKEENLNPEYLAMNPNGVVPTIRHNGGVVNESSVIVEYLDEVFEGGIKLSPANPLDRAEMRAWMRFIDEVPSMAVRVPSYQLVLRKRFDNMSEEEYDAFIHRNPVRNDFFKRMGRGGFNDEEYNLAIERLKGTFKRMDAALENTAWLNGQELSLADLCLVPIFQRLKDLELDSLWDDFSSVQSWFDRIQERPSFDKTYYPGARFMDQELGDSPVETETH